ncbi:hypothetical protein [Pseudomonas syringae]|uniref:hypothetical protein n=1 Tax=Pseudomonas syringae TaxID=317 RepID=UPI001F240854|nr:hypothetical protein [Pseudomonas syringae]MCF5374483.1 hypothetical protein [Pseudomonas syringae]
MGSTDLGKKLAAAFTCTKGNTIYIPLNQTDAPTPEPVMLHLYSLPGGAGRIAKEPLPEWLLNSPVFDTEGFGLRLDTYRQQMITTYEAIWPGEKVHAAYDVELIDLDECLKLAALRDPTNGLAKADGLRDSLLAALKALLEYEGTVVYTGIGEFPSDGLEAARRQAQVAIDEAEAL